VALHSHVRTEALVKTPQLVNMHALAQVVLQEQIVLQQHHLALCVQQLDFLLIQSTAKYIIPVTLQTLLESKIHVHLNSGYNFYSIQILEAVLAMRTQEVMPQPAAQ
jgi:hypothetical protein